MPKNRNQAGLASRAFVVLTSDILALPLMPTFPRAPALALPVLKNPTGSMVRPSLIFSTLCVDVAVSAKFESQLKTSSLP
jgi:hypothetical protein